jgi:hypothetical protein
MMFFLGMNYFSSLGSESRQFKGYVCMYVCMYTKSVGRQKLKSSHFAVRQFSCRPTDFASSDRILLFRVNNPSTATAVSASTIEMQHSYMHWVQA